MDDFFFSLVLAGISVGAVYALVALGLNLTFWTTKALNFGQGSLMMLCAMLTVYLAAQGLEFHDLEDDVGAFTVALPRLRVIPIEDFDPWTLLS